MKEIKRNPKGFVNTPPTAEEIVELMKRPLAQKVLMAQTRIQEWYYAWDGQCYVSFSGGKDSTVLSYLAASVLHNMGCPYPLYLLYLDTGLEYPEIRKFTKEYVEWLKSKFPGLEVVLEVERPKLRFDEVIKLWGYPYPSKEVAMKIHEARSKPGGASWNQLHGTYLSKNGKTNRKSVTNWKFLLDAPFKISHRCCYVMKKNPAKRYERRTKRKPIVGMMAEESFARKAKWLQTGCNAFDGDRPTSNPIMSWTQQDILRFIKDNQIFFSSVYGDILEDENGKLHTTGCDRTGCVFCLFGIHADGTPNRIQKLKETHPKQYEYCIKDVEEGGLGLGKVMDWLQIPYK